MRKHSRWLVNSVKQGIPFGSLFQAVPQKNRKEHPGSYLEGSHYGYQPIFPEMQWRYHSLC